MGVALGVGVSVGGLVAVAVAVGRGLSVLVAVFVGLATLTLAAVGGAVVGEAAAVMVTWLTSSSRLQAASEATTISATRSQRNLELDDMLTIVF